MPGRDKGKYEKIYQKNGVMTKGGGYEGRYGEDEELDRKWDRYGCAYEGKKLVGKVVKLKPKSLVDIGAGYNQFVKAMRKRLSPGSCDSSRIVGVDIACPGSDIIAPAHELPFEDATFDLITSFDCMEHIPEEEVPLAIEEFCRVGERIYLQICLAPSKTLIDGEPVHVCVKPKEWWLEKIEKYFPNAKIKQHVNKNTPWEHIVVYATK